MIKSINNVYSLLKPASDVHEVPLVFDSPHSGTVYPMNTGIIAPVQALKTTWDAWVDELWSGAPRMGAALLAARFPRTCIDTNRSIMDIDPEMLDNPWPGLIEQSPACKRGMGLIRRYALPNVPMYAAPLSVMEVEQRIRQYYEPYHAVLAELLDAAYSRFGQVWHINCHSMKSIGNAMNTDKGSERPDMVISDCHGTSAYCTLTEWIAGEFSRLGYRVQINTPYAGGYIIKKYGQPALGRQSIQIEIKRSLYMNEASFEKTEGFEQLQADLEIFVSKLRDHALEQLRERKIPRNLQADRTL
jgi:N-formylglutamate deformylase